MTEENPAQKSGFRRFTKAEIKQIRQVIRDVGLDKSHSEIAEALNEARVDVPSGQPWYNTLVSNFMRNHGMRKTKSQRSTRRRKIPANQVRLTVKPVATTPVTVDDDALELAQMVLASNVSKERKKKLLGSLF